LTTAASVLVSGGLFFLAEMPLPVVRRVLIRVAIFAGVMTSASLMWLVLTRAGAAFAFAPDTTLEAGLGTYVAFKLMADRGPLWLAAAQQIVAGPYLVMPAGRPLFPEIFGWPVPGEWNNGAHNSVLELVRNVGLVAGALGVALMGWALFRAMRVVVFSRRPAVRALAAAFVGVAITGVTTGNFPVQDVGFFVWGLGGLAVGLHTSRRGAPAPPARRAFARPAAQS
jgi:hypothetical protein